MKLNELLQNELLELCKKIGVPSIEFRNYAGRIYVYKINFAGDWDYIDEVLKFVGTQKLDVFEQFSISSQTIPVCPMTADDLPPPDPDSSYPTVGLIDSGTDPNNSHLQSWVINRDETLCPAIDQDNTHGSLVAGMLINGRDLNHSHPEFPTGQVKIVDVVAFPGAGNVTEDDLIESLEYAFKTYPEVKIWNLSLNSQRTCQHQSFSDFAIALDGLQDQYNVTVINSAGNFTISPFYPWKRPELYDGDRICSPGDSLRALTVGSIAHIEQGDSCSKVGEPSPFSRKGPGAAFTPKPELTHFGGNANPAHNYRQMGILSIDANNHISETVGTSFAAPLVAVTAAQVSEAIEEETNRHVLKAILIHSAVLNSQEVNAEDLPYHGFGKPPIVEDILRCNPWEATLLFDFELPYARRNFAKNDFPVPPCLLKDGKVFGEIIMTLVYDPPVDPFEGAAYSQLNVDASLGVCWLRGGKEEYSGRKIIPYPKDVKDMFEKNQIEHGFKWSPVKVFRKTMSRLTPRDTWRISLDMSVRKLDLAPDSQPVALLVTIRDPKQEQPVYDQVVAMMNRAGWITENLQVKEHVRVRASG